MIFAPRKKTPHFHPLIHHPSPPRGRFPRPRRSRPPWRRRRGSSRDTKGRRSRRTRRNLRHEKIHGENPWGKSMAIRMAMNGNGKSMGKIHGENHDSWIVWWCFWWEISPIWMGELSELHQNKQKLPSLVTGCHRLWIVSSRGIWMGNKLHQKLEQNLYRNPWAFVWLGALGDLLVTFLMING